MNMELWKINIKATYTTKTLYFTITSANIADALMCVGNPHPLFDQYKKLGWTLLNHTLEHLGSVYIEAKK